MILWEKCNRKIIRMRKFYSLIPFLFFFYSKSVFSIEKGPLEVKNTYPPVLIFLFPTPASPSTLKKGEILFRGDFIQSNIFQNGGDTFRTQVNMDMEVTRTAANFQFGLTDKLGIGIEQPFFYYSRGIADQAIQNYHHTFGFSNAGREFVRNYAFRDKIMDYGDVHTDTKPRADFGDMIVNLKWKILEESANSPLLSISPIVELPTGNHKYLMGNGKIDGGVGILLRKIIGDFSLYGNFYYISTGKTVHTQNVKVRPFVITRVYAISYKWSEKLSFLVQLNDSTSNYKSSQKNLDSSASLFSMGFKYSTSEKTLFALSFSEDFSHKTTPDVTLNFSFSYLFGWLFNDKDKKILYF